MKDESIKNNLTTLSNDIVKAKYKLDLPTHKLVLVGISKIDNRQVGEDIDGMDGKVVVPSSVEISVEEYASACEISVEHAKDVFQEVVNKLFEAEVAYWNVERSRYTRIRWVSSVEYDRTVHRVKLVWTEEVKPFICEQKKNFTSVKVRVFGKLTSSYSIRLHELLLMKLRQSRKKEVLVWFSVDELKELFLLEDKYNVFAMFYKKVIEKNITELNNCKEVRFDIRLTDAKSKKLYKKDGRKVREVGFILSWR